MCKQQCRAARSRDMFWPIYTFCRCQSLFTLPCFVPLPCLPCSRFVVPCSASRRPLCTSHAHEIRSNHPSCQDPGEGQDGPSCGQTCQCDGLLRNVGVGSTRASCLDDVVVAWVTPYSIMWEADVPSSDVRTATPLSLAFLDQG